ncbi:MAG: N-acetylmannosamine-6-phosphate 2-epimerase [Vallitaleaceae bacterium]|nr:N-acetylmannosamine-6-phosphate 2-epimerase [Vallitaleaceae bacterium]
MTNQEIKEQIQGKLIVSCQALDVEPLYSSYIMGRMAYAAMLGGASGIRANTVVDIIEIKKTVILPVIGIIKEVYDDSDVFITPTMKEVNALVSCGCEVIAMDATKRIRPNGILLDDFFKEVRKKYPDQLFMADCSSEDEGLHAAELGFDFIGTTMSGYTEYTKNRTLPDAPLVQALVEKCGKPVIAEGGIWTPEDLEKVLKAGAFAAVVGTAITRPMDITKRFVQVVEKEKAK